MGGFSLIHWGIVLLVFLLLFGRRRLSGVMGDMGSALGNFRRELSDEPSAAGRDPDMTSPHGPL